MLHMESVRESCLCRWYKQGSYEDRSKYSAVFTLEYETPTKVCIYGLCGEINKQFWLDVFLRFAEQGIETVKRERRGKWQEMSITDYGKLK